jgi:hypothetical protein
MAVEKKPIKSAEKAHLRTRKSKSGGEGKKKKVFAEDMGKAHLIELSNTIAESHSSKLKERIDKAKDKARWVKERRAQSSKPRTTQEVTEEEKKGKKVPLVSSSDYTL